MEEQAQACLNKIVVSPVGKAFWVCVVHFRHVLLVTLKLQQSKEMLSSDSKLVAFHVPSGEQVLFGVVAFWRGEALPRNSIAVVFGTFGNSFLQVLLGTMN